MRQALSLSLPAVEVQHLKRTVQRRGFSSVSAYIRQLVKDDEDIISEEKLVKRAAAAERNYRAGRVVRARSIADLLKNTGV